MILLSSYAALTCCLAISTSRFGKIILITLPMLLAGLSAYQWEHAALIAEANGRNSINFYRYEVGLGLVVTIVLITIAYIRLEVIPKWKLDHRSMNPADFDQKYGDILHALIVWAIASIGACFAMTLNLLTALKI